MAELTMLEAVNRTLHREMARDERVVVFGEDVALNGGVFRATEGLLDEFGERRVVDMPLAEAVILGSAVGLAAGGMVPVPEIQFLGFTYQGFHQLAGQIARLRFRSHGRFEMPVTIRAPSAAASGRPSSTPTRWRASWPTCPASRSSRRRPLPTWPGCSRRPSATPTRCSCSSRSAGTGACGASYPTTITWYRSARPESHVRATTWP